MDRLGPRRQGQLSNISLWPQMPPLKNESLILVLKVHRDRAPCDDLQTFSDPVPGSVLCLHTPSSGVSDFILNRPYEGELLHSVHR